MQGLTAFELLVTVAVGAILLTTGVPALRYLVLEARMTATVNAMVRDLHLARQAANVRGETVIVCPAATPSGCSDSGAWVDGWGVVVPRPREDEAATALLISTLPAAGVRLLSNRHSYAFRPFSLRDTNGTIGFCDQRGPDAARALVISPTGRPRLASRAEARARIKC